jgi:hypothetical protein
MLLTIVHWLETHMLACPYKKYMGLECPGCGLQRSFIELLKGNLIESLKLYPALVPLLFTFVLTALHLIFRYRNGASYVKWAYIFSASVIVVSFIVKICDHGIHPA